MYGEGRNLRYIIGLAAVIVLLFLAIFLIVHHGNGKGKVPETKQALTSYADDSNVTVTEHIVGPITASEMHREIEIRVTNTGTTAEVSQGYDGNVINSLSYPMTNTSFKEFLSALDKVGFTLGSTDEKLQDDSGYCARGNRYIYTITQGGNTVERFWATNCGGTKTYKGKLGNTLALFQAQVPGYSELTADTNVSSGSSLSL